VTNESAPQSRRRVRVPIGVAYGTDIDEFEALAVEAALAEPLVLDSPKPRARLRSFGDSALQYEILCWVNGPTRRRRAQHTLNRALYKTLSAADIEIPYPKRDVTVTAADGSATDAASGQMDTPSSTDDGTAAATRNDRGPVNERGDRTSVGGGASGSPATRKQTQRHRNDLRIGRRRRQRRSRRRRERHAQDSR